MDDEQPIETVHHQHEEIGLPEENDRKLVRWCPVTHTNGATPRPRHGHRAVVIKDIIVIFGGGNEGMINELHVYNPDTREFVAPQIRGQAPSSAAAFGAAVLGTKIYTFGGMIEYGKYTNEVHELTATRWEWRRMSTKTAGNEQPPKARLGHTFVASEKTQKAYMFGGLCNELDDNKRNVPVYMNDFYTLDLSARELVWEKPETHGISPSPRESHTAIIYETDKVSRMVIYGGMNGVRLGDIWYLDLPTLEWTQIKLDDPRCGMLPEPRSLHTSVLIKDKMYVYGGWVPIVTSGDQQEREWKCTSSLVCWDLSSDRWLPIQNYSSDIETMPRGRAGHCAAAIGERIFIWSGRDGYRKAWSNQVCCKDMWMLETAKPERPSQLVFGRTGFSTVEISWSEVPQANGYFVQIGSGDPKEARASEKRVQASQRKQPASARKNDEKNKSNTLISTQGTTYTAPVPAKQAADESELPQDLFEDPDKNERTSASPKPSGEAQSEAKKKDGGEGPSQTSDGNQDVDDIKDEDIPDTEGDDDDLPWFDVGIIKENTITVSHYFNAREDPLEDQLGDLIDANGFKCINDEVYTNDDKVALTGGQTYRFRVSAVNGLGRGAWSETATHKTSVPGFPSAPSSIRITKSQDGAQLTWEPPANAHISGKILEYSVYLAVKNQSANSTDSQLAFMRVYCGALAECNVLQPSLGSAYVDQSNKPAIIFRIAAKNEKGYGPATQVRWLQDQQKVPVRSAYPNVSQNYMYHPPQQKRLRFEHQ